MRDFPELFELNIPLWVVAIRLFAAALLGGILGWERETKRKPAGLRTFMLVSLGAASFMIVGLEMLHTDETARFDPTRVIQGIVSGIGFLGAGSILQSRGEVGGVTTAAGIWVVGGIGAACGAGYIAIAFLAVMLALLIMTVLRVVEKRIIHSHGDGNGPNPPLSEK
jgi:putative Mg2+ transporter-C (MgtC) family protein